MTVKSRTEITYIPQDYEVASGQTATFRYFLGFFLQLYILFCLKLENLVMTTDIDCCVCYMTTVHIGNLCVYFMSIYFFIWFYSISFYFVLFIYLLINVKMIEMVTCV